MTPENNQKIIKAMAMEMALATGGGTDDDLVWKMHYAVCFIHAQAAFAVAYQMIAAETIDRCAARIENDDPMLADFIRQMKEPRQGGIGESHD